MKILQLMSCRGWSSDAYWAARVTWELERRGHLVTLGCRAGTEARVIDRARTLLDLSEEQVNHSRAVLRRYGNMSSATILFVLEETLRAETPVPDDWALMIGLGPGFAAEGALLRW